MLTLNRKRLSDPLRFSDIIALLLTAKAFFSVPFPPKNVRRIRDRSSPSRAGIRNREGEDRRIFLGKNGRGYEIELGFDLLRSIIGFGSGIVFDLFS